MSLRITKFDYETKTVTFEEVPDGPTPAYSFPLQTLSDNVLREGLCVEGDGIDEKGMFINPRRVR